MRVETPPGTSWTLDFVQSTIQSPLGEAWLLVRLAVLTLKSSFLRVETPPETNWSLGLVRATTWALLVDLEVVLLPRVRVSLAYFGSLIALVLSLFVD